MDWNKICRIGIDRIVLSQFEAKKLSNFNINSSSIIPEIKENYYEINDLYHLKLYKSFNKIDFHTSPDVLRYKKPLICLCVIS